MMGINTKIEWCDHTWNPWYGCPDDGERTPACDNCYARAWAKRSGIVDFDNEIKRASDKTFYAPLNRNKFKSGDKVFVCSLSDVCHSASDNILIDMWNVIKKRSDLIWIFLTKRPEEFERILRLSRGANDICDNWWLGVTVENQEQADERIPLLLDIPASVRFVSCEPLLEKVLLDNGSSSYLTCNADDNYRMQNDGECCESYALGNGCFKGIDWVICGGESGGTSRPMHVDWVRSLRDQCKTSSVPFFFKQWGGTNKKQAGRLLDGKEYLEFPIQKVGER